MTLYEFVNLATSSNNDEIVNLKFSPNSFFFHTLCLSYSLSASCLPVNYNLRRLKRHVNHLFCILELCSFYCPFASVTFSQFT